MDHEDKIIRVDEWGVIITDYEDRLKSVDVEEVYNNEEGLI